jgi:uncharacterized protein YjbI with pentapeptide repeats
MKTAARHGIQTARLPKPLPAGSLDRLADHAQVTQISISEADFSSQIAANVLCEQALFRRVSFLQSVLPGLRLLDTRLERCELAGARWERARLRRVEFSGCRMLGADLGESSFDDVLFQECNAEGAVFLNAACKPVRFEKCNLRKAIFEGADLTGVVFDHCDISEATLLGAKLAGADLRTATLNGLKAGPKDLAGAIIAPAQAVQVAALLGVVVKDPDEDLGSAGSQG